MLKRVLWALFGAFVTVALVATVRAVSFVGKPFPGFLVYPNGMVTMFGSDDWPGVAAGLDAWDRVERVDGVPVRTAADVFDVVRSRPVGTKFRYTVLRGEKRFRLTVPSIGFGWRDFVADPLPFLVTGLVWAVAGVGVYMVRPSLPTFAFACFGLAMGAALLRMDFLLQGSVQLLQPIQPMIAAALVHLALVFPERPAALVRRPALLAFPYLLAGGLGVARGALLFRDPAAWARLDQLTFVGIGTAILCLIGRFVYSARRGSGAVARERARAVLWGLVPAVLVAGLGGVLRAVNGSHAALGHFALAAAWVWLGFLAYAAVKRNIFDFEIFVRRVLTYAITLAAGLGVYGLGLITFSLLLAGMGYSVRAAVPFVAVAVVAPLIPGFFRRLQRWVASRLFPLRVRLGEVVQDLSDDLSTLMEAGSLVRRVKETFQVEVGVRRVEVYRVQGSRWVPLDEETGGTAEPAPALPGLAEGRAASIFDVPDRRHRQWMQERGFALLLPLIARSRLEGVLALGEVETGRLFNSEDVDTLLVLASRLGISLANARAVERIRDLEGRLREENRALREELELHPGFPEIVGSSTPMRTVFRTIEQVAGTDTTVLLLGETGTGKELVARAIHVHSRRRDGPIVKVNCAAIPPDLIEAELFGHEKGAFTGAVARRRGRFELASGGTLFLDEVGELPLDVQGKLLRVLQEREFERVGGAETLRADVRVIAATNQDLRAAVRAGRFREDLFFRLDVFPVTVPPLRDRPEDLPLLVEHFVDRFNRRLGKNVRGLTEDSLEELRRYSWPGNVRELENVIERAMVLSTEEWIALPALDGEAVRREGPAAVEGPVRNLAEELHRAKRAAIDRALSVAETQKEAAALLGLKPSSLSRMLRDMGLR